MPPVDTNSSWNRHLPLSGACFTALMVAGAAAFPTPPSGDVAVGSQPAWLAAHWQPVVAQSYVRALAALAFIALSAAVAAACRRALPAQSVLPDVALVGGALSGGLVLLSQAAALAAALFSHAGANADAVRALGAVQDGFLDMSSIPAVLLFGAAGLAALSGGLLPRWLAIFSLLGVPLALVDAGSYDGGPLESVGFLGLAYFLAWSLLVGVRLYVGRRGVAVVADEPGSAVAI